MKLNEPLMSIWFGNFYRPAYDDRSFIDESMHELKRLGFNTVELDSKDWQDFREHFDGGEASPFVAMQEYMGEAAHREGLAHMFLILYLNGDNLYPAIRFSPPVYGDSVKNPDGSDGRWYRYWSEAARDTMMEHVSQFQSQYGEGQAETEDGKIPICSMWDPIVAPSFDEEGIARYTEWLRKCYGTIEGFNRSYGTAFTSFKALRPEDYWFTIHYGENRLYSPADLAKLTPAFMMWADNMRWRAEELTDYFRSMEKRLHAVNPRLFLMPNLSQWSHFLNIDTSAMPDVGLCDFWDTANRGIDMRQIAPYVDMCHWFTLPVTMTGDPDAWVVSCQHAHMRSLNRNRDWYGGIYWGRFLYQDIYRYITPEETIGSIIAAGAKGINAYGWCGLDDGGILHRMDEGFLDSLSRGNAWAKRVIPLTGKRLQGKVAILFPAAMALLEPLGVEGAAERRSDLLGLYHFCCDYGYAPDIVEKEDVIAGLSDYKVLLIPADDCYHAERDAAFEAALVNYVEQGGTVIHSACAEAAELSFGVNKQEIENTGYHYQGEGGLLSREHVYMISACRSSQAQADWCDSGNAAILVQRIGRGLVYSFGFMPGYQYAAKKAPHVPARQRNNELYPFTHMRSNPLEKMLYSAVKPDMLLTMKDVECAPFEKGWIVVNHRSVPVALPKDYSVIGTQDAGSLLPGHSSAFMYKEIK